MATFKQVGRFIGVSAVDSLLVGWAVVLANPKAGNLLVAWTLIVALFAFMQASAFALASFDRVKPLFNVQPKWLMVIKGVFTAAKLTVLIWNGWWATAAFTGIAFASAFTAEAILRRRQEVGR